MSSSVISTPLLVNVKLLSSNDPLKSNCAVIPAEIHWIQYARNTASFNKPIVINVIL